MDDLNTSCQAFCPLRTSPGCSEYQVMWPWGHLIVGYLGYTIITRLRGTLPTQSTVIALAIGTQIPDLIDKPLAYWWLLPEGRSLAHSILFAIPVCAVLYVISQKHDHEALGFAFTVGYGSHLLADSWRHLLTGQFESVSFLLWPVVAAPNYSTDSFSAHWHDLATTLETINLQALLSNPLETFSLQLLFAGLVVLLWIGDGMPGLALLPRPDQN